jgi:hypothetical protein
MRVKVLKYSVAPDTLPDPPARAGDHPAFSGPQVEVAAPSWPDVEAAVRRLDGRRYPGLILWPTADPAGHDPDPGSHEFVSVYGGAGVYSVRVSFDDGREAYLHFPDRPNRPMVVLPDPWGFADGAATEDAPRVCQDVEVVVRAVRHYCVAGGLDSSLQWEVLR